MNPFTIDEVRVFWDSVAELYTRVNRGLGWTHTERFETMVRFLPLYAQTILNVWSRTGSAVPFLRARFPQAELRNLEVSPRLLTAAQTLYPREHFALTDLHTLPCATESQDVIVSLETLEHVPDPLHFLLECHRILRVGGRLILSTPPAWCEWPLRLYERFFENHGEGPHQFLTVRAVLRTLRQCDFTVVLHQGTVFFPIGPDWLKWSLEWFHAHVLRFIGFDRLTIRHFFVAEKRSSVDPVWAKIREEIVRPGLSMHSGTDVGLSEGTLRIADPDGSCLPEPTGKGPVPSICYDASPEVAPSYPAMHRAVFGSPSPTSSLLGEYRRLAVAYHTDPIVRSAGASGGILTGVLLHLLDTQQITGAVVCAMDPLHPWRAIPTVARTREEILAAAQSKYVTAPMNTILGELNTVEGPLAYVGLPHQIFAIRRLQQREHPSARNIRFLLGPFFGNELSGSAIQSFVRRYGASIDHIERLSFRAGEWPGRMEVRLKDGRLCSLPKFHANYLIPFHITQSSLLSHDLTNEFTDLSGGDAWSPVYEERGKGFSLLIVRSAQAMALVTEMQQRGLLHLEDLSEQEVIAMQSHGLDFKKRGTFLRIERMQRRGMRVPQYGLCLGPVPWSRRAFERVLGTVFALCRHSLIRRIADAVPEAIMGRLFVLLRTRWKAATKTIKRSSLSETILRAECR